MNSDKFKSYAKLALDRVDILKGKHPNSQSVVAPSAPVMTDDEDINSCSTAILSETVFPPVPTDGSFRFYL